MLSGVKGGKRNARPSAKTGPFIRKSTTSITCVRTLQIFIPRKEKRAERTHYSGENPVAVPSIPSYHRTEGSPWAGDSTFVPPYLGIQAQTPAAGCLVMQAAEELIPSQWREHQVACGGASTEANGWHQPASELLLRATTSPTMYVAHLCTTLHPALRTREAVWW